MVKRNIVVIDEEKCTGCGLCVPNCPEGALQIIDGKARLVGELLCDGLGACVGQCPEGAMTITHGDVEEYDEGRVMHNVVKGGVNVIGAHLKHLQDHNQREYYKQAIRYLHNHNIPIPKEEQQERPSSEGCPGMMIRDFRTKQKESTGDVASGTLQSELGQWPVQLQLLYPHAPYFKDADIVIAADCVPFAHADFHRRFLKGKTLIIFCPKLDTVIEIYKEKLTTIFRENNIKSITIVHMEVPCCFGTVKLVEDALKQSGKNIVMKEYTISLQGETV